jgi:hypothetical protein
MAVKAKFCPGKFYGMHCDPTKSACQYDPGKNSRGRATPMKKVAKILRRPRVNT